MNECLSRLKLYGLVFGITVKSAVQGITIPIILTYYTSMNFIMTITSIQFLIVFGIAYFVLTRGKIIIPAEKKLLIFLSGLFTGLMSLCMTYSANPSRTPIMLQAILASLPILPSVLLRKLFLKKLTIYKKRLIIPSVILLIISVGFSTIPLDGSWDAKGAVWSLMYAAGIVFQSAYNVMQEKYITETGDYSLLNKITIIFGSRIVEILTLISLFWLDYFIGYGLNPFTAYFDSMKVFAFDYKAALLFEGFVLAYIIAYVMGIYLNTISSNYNMIVPAVANPLVAIFFTVFSYLNIGIQYPLWVVIPSICMSTAGMVLWILGEKQDTTQFVDRDTYEEIGEIRTQKGSMSINGA